MIIKMCCKSFLFDAVRNAVRYYAVGTEYCNIHVRFLLQRFLEKKKIFYYQSNTVKHHKFYILRHLILTYIHFERGV